MEYSASTFFLVSTLIFLVPVIIIFAALDSTRHEVSEIRLLQGDLVSMISMAGMAVIFLSFRTEIFYVANNHLL